MTTALLSSSFHRSMQNCNRNFDGIPQPSVLCCCTMCSDPLRLNATGGNTSQSCFTTTRCPIKVARQIGDEIMTHWTRNDWTVLGSSAVATGALLVSRANAVAHEGHPHGEEAETAAPTTDEQTAPSAEAASAPSAATVHTPATDRPMQTHNSPDEATSETMTTPAVVSQARITEGFSIGLGESLLGLIIAGPFLLLTLKKRLQA
jgi:hypothetical protein